MTVWRVITLAAFMTTHATSALAAPLATGGGFEPPLVRLVLGFALCAMLALLAALALKRFFFQGGGRLAKASIGGWFAAPAREIEIRETRRISANADVCAIGWRQREFLVVVCAGGGATVLDQRESKTAVETPV